jgi:hypothetical protein
MSDRPVPLLGDISLELAQRIEHSLEGGFASTRIAGLPGELQQRSGRPSHRIRMTGFLHGDAVADQIQKLQEAAQSGGELTFAADITNAVDLQKVVITAFRAVETAGVPGRYEYDITVAESPPLPPPAQIGGFGGLDDFGLGDLGFDAGLTDMLDDLQAMAGEVAGAVESAMNVVDQLGALASMGDLGNLSGFLAPMQTAVEGVGSIASNLGEATRSLLQGFQT